MRPTLFALTILALVPLGCGSRDQGPVDKVITVKDDDAKMNAAIAKARATVDDFITALHSGRKGRDGFSVKKQFSDDGKHEHMWLTEVTFDGKRFHGVVNNEPGMVKNVKMGQKAFVERGKISDWMFIDNGRLKGGYTLRVLRDNLPPDERAAFDKQMPFKID